MVYISSFDEPSWFKLQAIDVTIQVATEQNVIFAIQAIIAIQASGCHHT